MGTCVVALNIPAKSYVLSDKNPHLVRFYKSLQSKEFSHHAARKFLLSAGERLREEGEEYYYFVRERFNSSGNPLDFLFLNRACFNGMIRFNKKGNFNVPFCRKENRFSAAYITKICNQIEKMASFLQYNDIKINCCDFRDVIDGNEEKDTVIYCDPPYIDRHADYYNAWDEKDEKALHALLLGSKTNFILSTWHHNKFRRNVYIEKLWSTFSVITREHFYHVGANLQNRNTMTEALITTLNIQNKSFMSKNQEQYNIFNIST